MNTHPHYIASSMRLFSQRATSPLLACLGSAIIAHSLIEFIPVIIALSLYALTASIFITMVLAEIGNAVIVLGYDSIRALRRALGREPETLCQSCVSSFAGLQQWKKR